MFEVKGKYNKAVFFADVTDNETISQVMNLLKQPFLCESKIRIMADCHAGKGCVIGTTMTIQDKVIPNLVGVDIGCGMEVVELQETELDFEKLDSVIRGCVPSGFSIRSEAHPFVKQCHLSKLHCAEYINGDRAELSLGTLGGGNHFIEIDKAPDGRLFLVIHTGSRNLGKQTAEYYQNEAWKRLSGDEQHLLIQRRIEELKKEGRQAEIEAEIRTIKESRTSVPKELAYCEGSLFERYMHDMKIVQQYAALNRQAIANVILSQMGLRSVSTFTTIHNYIDVESMILRKGAVSAKDGERLIIPINMRDGALICTGKGNEEYNYSAPHGAGRIMSRSKAKTELSVEAFKDEMSQAGIFTTSCNASTLDEAPGAYKPIESILENITDTVNVDVIVKPVYNYKAGL